MRKTALLLFAGSLLAIVGGCSIGEEAERGSASAPVIGDPNPNGKPPGETCAKSNECRTGVCNTNSCQAAKPTDGVKNGQESDVDCGGKDGPSCANGKACATDENCASKHCAAFKCAEPGAAGGEAPKPDLCGKDQEAKCADGAACKEADDCTSKVCDAGRCKAPSFEDKVQNGTETDVDCGGSGDGPRCDVGQSCKTHSDCSSNGCAFDGKCAIGASCTQLEGGHTCGPNDDLSKQKDCCERASLPGGGSVDKYLITAGRMRAFITRLDGKVRDFAAKLPNDKWNQGWTSSLPNAIDGEPGDADNANTQLGPHFGKRSCESGNYNGHTYFTPNRYGDSKQDFPQNVLDTKALNCVPWHLLAALCAFDGGHLIKESELRAAYTNGGSTQYPWGSRGAYTTQGQNDFAIQQWSYVTPDTPADARTRGTDHLDSAFYIAPPGRRPAGYNSSGVADLVGNLLEWVGDSEKQFVWKGSWETHAYEADRLEAGGTQDPYMAIHPTKRRGWKWDADVTQTEPNGYYAIGGRCAY